MQQKEKEQFIKELKDIRDNHLEVTLTVRNNTETGKPSSPPKNPKIYKEKITNILEECRPALLIVEKKETSPLYYDGTALDYKKQLNAAARIAHKKGAKITNGGIEGDLIAFLTYSNYLEKGQKQKAKDFAKRAFDPVKQNIIKYSESQKAIKKITARAERFLKIYENSLIDYINIHWSSDDPKALEEVVKYIKKRTGLPVVSTEMKRPRDLKKARKLIKKTASLNIPCVIWFFSIEAPQAKSMIGEHGTLRKKSRKFHNFVRTRFLPRARIRNTYKAAEN